MKKVSFLSLWAAAILVSCGEKQEYAPEGKRLRDIVEDKYGDTDFLLGGTTDAWAFDSVTGMIMDNEYSYVTPENDFKHRVVRSDSGSWDWSRSDKCGIDIRKSCLYLRCNF